MAKLPSVPFSYVLVFCVLSITSGCADSPSAQADMASQSADMVVQEAQADMASREEDGAPSVADLQPASDLSPAPDLAPTKLFGEACTASDECVGQRCIGFASATHCSMTCDPSVATSCASVNSFCITTTTMPACMGTHPSTGSDGEDAILNVGDSLQKYLAPLSDVDLFSIALPPGSYLLTVTPQPGLDVAVDIYDEAGALAAIVNQGGDGVAEVRTITLVGSRTTVTSFIVRNAGTNSNSYTISVTKP